MGRKQPLPYDATVFDSVHAYVDSLLDLVDTHVLIQTLCGRVHILDFFTTENPDLYSRVLPQEWRSFFSQLSVMDILDLLMRENLDLFDSEMTDVDGQRERQDRPMPPESLLEYIRTVRKHLLLRNPCTSQCSRNRAMKSTQKLSRRVTVGMTVKKVHEVGLFAQFIDNLASSLSISPETEITHFVDFGSGQNYLGRVLASEPYNKRIVAIESKSHNSERAKEYDVLAQLVAKKRMIRNKKAYRAGLEAPGTDHGAALQPTPPPEHMLKGGKGMEKQTDVGVKFPIGSSKAAKGRIQYVEHRIKNGYLGDVIEKIRMLENKENDDLGANEPRLLVMSLHSCGNLVHHGLRSLLMNPEVKAVAMVGCCYNLLTERLRPATYKMPELRPPFPESESASQWTHGDPHGFPMSYRLCSYKSRLSDTVENQDSGISLHITTRMMAVQAPYNWGPSDSEKYFTRHFYRALLQRIFFDKGIVGPPRSDCAGGSPAGHSSGTPIIIGTLPKSAYGNFVAYTRGALSKLYEDPKLGELFMRRLGQDMISDEEIRSYERKYGDRKKDLSVIWSLMAFSAGVIEAIILVDRWLWLREQQEVKDAWVESVFEYGVSPRNLVVVGVKK
ncbi:hypothetical protein M433DRAFT_63053 [Acidomyces richmondensis BFW]|nr:MAG: hypothetical protein FE78DRAFT_141483 [Acidomyces sp. 'richmondensis']KYG47472.1 hypothetical protein M433DRAFT_63053 [Acidomyces richmondensis BFW]